MRILAFDTETALIQPGLLAPPMVCGSFAESDNASVNDRATTLKVVRHALENKHVHIVGANVPFDLAVVCAEAPDLLPAVFRALEEGRIHDTHIRQALDAIAKGHLYKDPRTGGSLRDPETNKEKNRYSLAICCDITLGRKVDKVDTYRMRYARLRDVPLANWPAEAIDYSKSDAQNTLDLYLEQEKTFENLQCEPDEVRAAWALHLMATWGLRTDPARVAEVAERVEAMHHESQAKFIAAGILRPDGTKDTKALADRVSKAFGGNPPTTATGRVKCDRDTLNESGDDLLAELAEAGENEKLFTTYLSILRQGTRVPINASFNVLVDSGRTSCSRPNLQNLPRGGGIRECFVARRGYVFCSVDYAALELCTLAQVNLNLFGKSKMAEAINASPDGPGALHTALAAQFVGLSVEELTRRIKAGDKAAKELRQAAKAANFGFPGGMGAAKLVLAKRKEGLRFCVSLGRSTTCGTVKVTEHKGRQCPPVCKTCVEVAEELRNAWFIRWPEMREYFERVANETAGELGGRITSFGNGMVRGACGFTDGANHRFQNLAAQGAKRALWEVTRESYVDKSSALYGSRPVAFIHDEIVAEVPEARAHEAGERMAAVMVAAMRKYCPDVAISAEPCLMRFWYKEAATVRDSDGRLQVWEPAST